MKLCVGAVSRRVVEVAAASGLVHQIVASRGQVDVDGGYTGMTQRDLMRIVQARQKSPIEVVRDHGGPLQGGHDDDGVRSLVVDMEEGFHGLHLDVCKVARADQLKTLRSLLAIVSEKRGKLVGVEIGGEHDEQEWNDFLLAEALADRFSDKIHVTYGVVEIGTHVWADAQYGRPLSVKRVGRTASWYRFSGVRTKAHNMDWVGDRKRFHSVLDAYNLAPEIGVVETRALLTALPWATCDKLLDLAYDSRRWERWFKSGEGTRDERAVCALRYLQNEVRELTRLNDDQEKYVRGVILGALARG